MPFVVGRINESPYWGTPEDLALVRDAQVAVSGKMKYVSWVNTDGLSVFDGSETGHADPDHYDTHGQLALGALFANQVATIHTPEPSALAMAITALLAILGGGAIIRKS
jgi:hypothetical protein